MREWPDAATGASRTADGPPVAPRTHRRGLIVATVAALLMTLTGAFGTDAMPLWPRLAYWLILMETGALIGIGAMAGVRGWGGLDGRPLAEGAVVSLLIAVPLTLVVAGATLAFIGGRAPTVAGLALQFGMVLAITATITAVNYAIARPPAATPVTTVEDVPAPAPAPSPATAPAPPRLSDRLPLRLRHARIHAAQAEDHYLRVYTSAGSEIILMRLGDAVAELEGVEGARTHRSWWVARDAVTAVERFDGRATLALPDGVIAPVSRSFMRSLQADGWFDRDRGPAGQARPGITPPAE